MKKFAEDITILHVGTKNHNHVIMVPEIQSETDRIFCHLGPFLAFQPPDNPENQNFKIEKNAWRYNHFTHDNHMTII